MKKSILILACFALFFAGKVNSRTITGLVIDDNANPLPGVTIVVKGTSTGVVTDINGRYTINAEPTQTLVFSFIGFQTIEKKVDNKSIINVQMVQDLAVIEEVVVVGYGVQKKESVVASITQAKGDGYHRKSRVNNALSGFMPGVAMSESQNISGYHYPQQEPRNTEGYATIHENGPKKVSEAPLSTFSIDVDAASYANMRRFINNGQQPPIDAIRLEEMINYFDYNYPQPDGEHPFSINTELGTCPWNNDKLLLHIGLQGQDIPVEDLPASNLVFLIDVSGSMSSANKLPLLKQAFKMLVKQLRANDRVAIVVYAGSSGLVLNSTSGDEKEVIISALDRLHAGGSTAGAAGLKLAYQVAMENFIKEGNNRILLATDGDFNVGQSSNAEMERLIEKQRDNGVFISVLGFGMGNYKDDKMEIIADKGNGNYAYIDNILEAKKVFVNEFGGTLFTIAKDVKIQIEFNPLVVSTYRLIGYENRLLNNEDFDDDKKDAGELGSGHTVTALYEIELANGRQKAENKLKYQQISPTVNANLENELATVKFRYKKPDGNKSILMEQVIGTAFNEFKNTTENYRFSAAVAGYGMLLRKSEYIKTLKYGTVIDMAKASKGADKQGLRSEFIRLVELSETNHLANK